MEGKKKMLVSFSGGETSAYMAWWLKTFMSHVYDFVFVFANTGQESEKTLEFVNKVDKEFDLGVVWVEAIVRYGVRAYGEKYYFADYDEYKGFMNSFDPEEFKKEEQFGYKKDKETGEKIPKFRKCVAEIPTGTKHRVVTFETADRSGKPFEDTIKKFMIPNMQNFSCTREMKLRPIKSYARSIGWKKGDYVTAVGIREDEMDRISEGRKKEHLVYPLISNRPMTKQKINFWWSQQPFRLELKGYEGNCKTCWKKSDRKLGTIALERPEWFDFFREMEKKYEYHLKEGRNMDLPIRFFTKSRTVDDMFEIPKKEGFVSSEDDHVVYDPDLDLSNGCTESCEVF